LFLNPEIKQRVQVYLPVPKIDLAKCRYCGRCSEACAFHALAVLPQVSGKQGKGLLFPELCHGCGTCRYVCPQGAITETNREIGIVEIGASKDLQFLQGILNVGEVMAPSIIREVKKYINSTRTIVIDAPPGTSCPVVASVQGSDYCVLVTEPTPFGLHDLKLAVAMLRKINIRFGVVINRAGLGDDRTEHYCQREGIEVLLKIPFDAQIAKAYSQGKMIVAENQSYQENLVSLYLRIKEIVNENI